MIFEEAGLTELLEQFGEEQVSLVLSDFVCRKNSEVEDFIKYKAVINERKGLSRTVLIFENNNVVGYYAVSTKSFVLEEKLNSSQKKRFFGSSQTNGNIIPAILIGQLGKNENVETTLSGSDLMSLIFNYIRNMSKYIPSMIVYVEHNGADALFRYYESQGFIYFPREREETEKDIFCHIIKTADILDMF